MAISERIERIDSCLKIELSLKIEQIASQFSSKTHIHENIQSIRNDTQLADYWIAKRLDCHWSNTDYRCVTLQRK